MPNLLEWEKKKFTELFSYEQNSIGKECTVGKLGKRVREYARRINEIDKGIIPFELAVTTGDYWPDMDIDNELNIGLSKRKYITQRGNKTKKILENQEQQDALTRQEEIKTAFVAEREVTQTLINNAISKSKRDIV